MVVREALLPSSSGDALGLQENPPQQQDGGGPEDRGPTPQPEETKASRLCDYWAIHGQNGDLSHAAQQLVEASWRNSTESRYAGAWRRWLEWCGKQKVPPTSPTLKDVVNYLASLFEEGVQYRTLNLHRSALSATLKPIDGFCVGKHPLVCRLLKGSFNMRPPRPKLCPSWSIEAVLRTLETWSPASTLDLKHLTLKTVMLIALVSSKRPSSLSLLSIKEGFCAISESRVRFQPIGLEKTEGPDHYADPLII